MVGVGSGEFLVGVGGGEFLVDVGSGESVASGQPRPRSPPVLSRGLPISADRADLAGG